VTAPRLAVSHVRHSYSGPGGALPVLDDVSLTVDRGEFVSVVGPSGSGKSTLFGVLTGIVTPDSGTVALDGAPPPPGPRPVAWMPQRDALLPWRTVERNVALGLEARGVPARRARARARELLPAFGLDGFRTALPHQLSGGMRQRASFARTVAQGLDTLLLDEPFGALDALTRTDLQLWLLRLWEEQRWTVLLITHDVREAVLLSDRIVVLGPRPAGVVAEIDVALARPRSMDAILSAAGVALEREVLRALSTAPDGRSRPDQGRGVFARR
jgi:ABC-type nitrate/sulfonate/bicarbonate transport system ATPase subunit